MWFAKVTLYVRHQLGQYGGHPCSFRGYITNEHSHSSKVVIIVLVCQMRTQKLKLPKTIQIRAAWYQNSFSFCHTSLSQGVEEDICQVSPEWLLITAKLHKQINTTFKLTSSRDSLIVLILKNSKLFKLWGSWAKLLGIVSKCWMAKTKKLEKIKEVTYLKNVLCFFPRLKIWFLFFLNSW